MTLLTKIKQAAFLKNKDYLMIEMFTLEAILKSEEKKVVKSSMLLPCPLCGSKAKLVIVGNNEYYPVCSKNKGMCLLARKPIAGEDGFTVKADAIELWNKRAKGGKK